MSDSESNLRHEIGHVLFIDIVGYSKLLIEEQKEQLNQLTAIVLATAQVRDSTDEQLVRLPTGDGMALVFRHSAEEPARCALEIAEALRKHPELAVRMGIHSGPVSEVTDVSGRTNIAGAGINMAQRVMDCGDAGHILLSQHVADDLVQYRQWAPHLRDLGECEVKHGVRLGIVCLYNDQFGNPHLPRRFAASRQRRAQKRWALAVVAIVLVAAATSSLLTLYGRARSAASSIAEKSIAVLPFENLSSDKENAYFADGIQDEILTRLSRIADLKVISRTSTQHYRARPENLSEIGRQLRVANILEGSVQKSGDAVRVNVQLIRAANDSHLWADTYDRRLTDVFSVESDVAKAIADQLQAKITGEEAERVLASLTARPEAYDAYLRGLAYSLKNNSAAANNLGAQKYLREATRLDPKLAVAWALLSYVDARGYLTQTLQPTADLREEARNAAETAYRLQPQLGEAVLAVGYYHYACLKDYDGAVHYLAQARGLLPNSSKIAESLAYVERRRGRWEQSENYFVEAERIDPRNVILLTQHANSYTYLRRFDDALRKVDQILNITPDDPNTLTIKVRIAQAEGNLPRAASIIASLPSNVDDPDILEPEMYQAIIERNTATIIAKVKEALAKPNPALGYYRGELGFWLGWAEEVAGDRAGAERTWQEARGELEQFLKQEPENYVVIGDLALTRMGLGDKPAAFELINKAGASVSFEKDALDGAYPIEILARVAAQMGEPDQAMGALEKLLSVPIGKSFCSAPLTPALLSLDPMFDPLRDDPRFQKLCERK